MPPPTDLRPPAPSKAALPGLTAPPPLSVRPPGVNYLDDMITLRPQYEVRPLDIRTDEDGSVRIEPAGNRGPKPAPKVGVMMGWDAVPDPTSPQIDARDTSPNLELPLRAPASSPVLRVPPGGSADRSWSGGLEARLNRQLDDDFGTETPVSAPTRAELQALLDSPPDVTRQQSVDEIEALHHRTRDRPSQDLEFTRRVPYPTSEIDEADIEAAIELAPPARRGAIGVAKKPTKE